jgi:putative ABC transport system permease protein
MSEVRIMGTFWQDIRYGLRVLIKSPSLSIVATIALALGIGANTAIFSVVNAVLLRPLPFPNSEGLMSVFESDTGRGLRGSYSYPNFFDLRDQNHVFDHIAAYHDNDFTLTGQSQPVMLHGAIASADLFSVLGVTPMLGRTFAAAEDKPTETGRVLVLSERLFASRFNSDASVINKTITLNGHSYTIIGVMPKGFEFPIQNDPLDLWTTIADDAAGEEPITAQRGAHFLRVIGRLKPGVSKSQAQAEADTIGARLTQQYPDTNTRKGIHIEPTLQALVGDVRPALLILLGAVACVLLIACANVANLLLARAMTRHKEMALRSALGASRLRVVRQLLTESILLSFAGGVLGLGLAVWWSDLLIALGKKDIPRAIQVGLDWRVLGFTLGVTLLTGCVFGLVPALYLSKTDLTESLKEGRGTGGGARKNRVRGLLVIAELAIAVVLLVGAGLLIQSFWRLQHVNSGLQAQNVLTFNVSLPEVRYSSEKQARFYRDLANRLRGLPGVQSASAALPLPLSGDRFGISFQIDGRPVAPKDEPSADVFMTELDYFRTMGIPLLKGRDFDQRDDHKSAPVVIISDTFAQQFFPGEDPIGKRIKPGLSTWENDKSQMREIIGVVSDIRNRALNTEPKPVYYLPQSQVPFSELAMVVKTSNDPRALISSATREVQAMDSDLPVFSVKTMDEYVSSSVAAPRFNTTLLAIFAIVALLLTVIGLYGVMSYSVAQRTNEIGIRMALGAQTRDVLGLVVKDGVKMVAIGLLLGMGGALALTRLLETLLFGVTTRDPMTFLFIAALLSLVAMLACYIPAWRATRVDPLEALRCE